MSTNPLPVFIWGMPYSRAAHYHAKFRQSCRDEVGSIETIAETLARQGITFSDDRVAFRRAYSAEYKRRNRKHIRFLAKRRYWELNQTERGRAKIRARYQASNESRVKRERAAREESSQCKR